VKLFTIGFTKKTAKQFFDLLKQNGVNCLIDIRLHPDGQLAGFTKKVDLQYFLKELNGCEYLHWPQLAPSDEILKAYRENHDWPKYAEAFDTLLDQRSIPNSLERPLFEEKVCCFLCSEPTAEKCHRRLVAERLAQTWGGFEIIHL
jgi:uncharacterized protein (DUF488 family)